MSQTERNSEEELIFTAENGVGIITLNRPHRRNALTFAMYDRISASRAGNRMTLTICACWSLWAGDAAFAQQIFAIQNFYPAGKRCNQL